MRHPPSLRTRITLVVAGVAALAVLITGAVLIPVVRTAAVADARDRLASQVELLASAGASAVAEVADDADGASFAVVRGANARGAASSYATKAVRRALREDGTFSGRARGDDGVALVEARTAAGGAGIIGALPVRDVERSQWGATWRTVLALLLGLVLAVLAGWLLARWVARPLQSTVRAARRLAGGERGIEVPVDGPAETRELAAALTALDSALASSEGRQREFLLSVSHELRTPLSAIRGYAEALADGMVAGEATADVGRTLVAETERLDLFVADLLALARLEADDFRLEPATVDVAAVAREAVTAWEGRAATLDIALRATGEPAVVRTDPRRVRQVLDGLVENALRATPPGGRVVIRTAPDAANAALLEVADTGPGLSPEDAGVAFERGLLHARYRATRPVGTGLGLSIAARLVGRLGGSIATRPGEPGGAVFGVRVPSLPG